jgi:XTP/dITP diphosphohydrolase
LALFLNFPLGLARLAELEASALASREKGRSIMSVEFWIATTNKGKLAELEAELKKSLASVEIHNLSELRTYSPPPETGKSFAENALIKAKSLRALKPHAWILAEDSGLEVEALNGLPGIHSARYAGEKASDSENNAKLLKMLQIRSAGNRKARFFCSLIVLGPQGQQIACEAPMNGSIAAIPKGQLGFGYDPIFVPEGQQQTLAELGPGFKLQQSHRAAALRNAVPQILAFLSRD